MFLSDGNICLGVAELQEHAPFAGLHSRNRWSLYPVWTRQALQPLGQSMYNDGHVTALFLALPLAAALTARAEAYPQMMSSQTAFKAYKVIVNNTAPGTLLWCRFAYSRLVPWLRHAFWQRAPASASPVVMASTLLARACQWYWL